MIVRTSAAAILTNLLLAACKAAAGVMTHSIAVTLDAVNNLSDVLSSVITIAGMKLAGKRPDREHPMGHGRIEYISAMVVSVIVLYAGLSALRESVVKILHPVPVQYGVVPLLILTAAVPVKILLGLYVRKTGEKVHSGALIASGTDALSDAALSGSVLAAALLYLAFGISLEAWVGLLIACFIIRAGIGMIRETADDILGKRADENKTREIRRILNAQPQVKGAYDLILHNYGPEREYGSVHLELPDTMTVEEVDVLSRKLEAEVYAETGVILTGIGVYSYNTEDSEAAAIRNTVQEKVLSHDWALQLHGFHVDTEAKAMEFDVVMSFDIDARRGLDILGEEIRALYPDYSVSITPDVDMTD